MAKKGKKENIIGKVIYGTLMFAPIIAVGSNVLISTFNKNVAETQETQINYKYKTNEVNTLNDIHVENTYSFTYTLDKGSSLEILNDVNIITLLSINGDLDKIGNDNYISYTNLDYLTISCSNTGELDINFDNTDDEELFFHTVTNTINIIFTVTYFDITGDFFPIEYVKPYYLVESLNTKGVNTQDNFYYAIDKLENSKYFNWAKNNDIYTGIKVVTDGLNITTDVVPLILTYWLIMSLIYFIYDMILMILNMLHNKIHECQSEL